MRDNGIGMSRDAVIDLICTLAHSGTAELLYCTVLLAEGSEPEDPAHFAKLLANLLAHTIRRARRRDANRRIADNSVVRRHNARQPHRACLAKPAMNLHGLRSI
ncbi:hypothetical protein GCM10027068_40330 [Prescottella soli]